MDAKMVRALQQCPDRGRLVREWTDCSNRLSKLEGEKLAAIRNANPDLASFEAKLRWPRQPMSRPAVRTIST
jgi:hypothetical protein